MEVAIEAEGWRAVVSPQRGGQLCALSSKENGRRRNWIKTLESGEQGDFGGGHVRVQAPGQIGLLDRDPPPFGWPETGPAPSQAAWQLSSASADRVAMLYRHCSRSMADSAYQLGQSLTLAPGRLSLSLSMCNLGPSPLIRRLGWQLRLPDEFSYRISLDPDEPTVQRPPRGQVLRQMGWSGAAVLSTMDGRQMAIAGEGGLHGVTVLRHEGRPGITLQFLTADIPTMEPLERGAEWHVGLHLTLTGPPSADHGDDKTVAHRPRSA